MKLPRILSVKWRDACFYSEDQITADKDLGPIELYDVGYLVKRTKEAVTIALEYCPEQDDFRHVQTIPIVNVVKLRYLT